MIYRQGKSKNKMLVTALEKYIRWFALPEHMAVRVVKEELYS